MASSFRDLIPVYSRLTPGRATVLPTDFATDTGTVDPRLLTMMAPQSLPLPGLTSRKVNTVPIDPMTGNPILTASSPPPVRSGGPGWRPAYTVGTQPAGSVAMPPGARPASVALPPAPPAVPQQQQLLAGMFGRGNAGYWDGSLKGQDRLPTDMAYMTGPGGANPALGAIEDQMNPSGRSTAFPFPLMGFNQPRYSEPIDITIQGGNKAPNVSLPRARPSPPQIPGAITFKQGDTVSELAKARGMTTASFADLFGISNPNRIKAGQTVFRQAPVMPRMPPAGLNRAPPQVPMPRQRPNFQRTPASRGETFDSVWAEARG
jgi:LysM repeat protein